MDRKARYMRETCNELGRAAESELHSLAQGRGLVLEDDDGQSRGKKRAWEEARLNLEAENIGATRINGPIVNGSQQINTISSMPTQSANTYMTPEMTGFEAVSTIDGFSGGSMIFPGAVVGMNDIFDAPLLHQLSHPLYDAAVAQPSLFRASGQT
ncbi:hypothetical protein IAQ61_010833 [Plenodomus lingam]|uniref:uncharacterized protein n=1 Tax=Leptosphaeria maculans TaxID=5022 RepID=UPI0033189A88|nr:hypothetical protein IAQ61_010833 [Plenodomus lingam]